MVAAVVGGAAATAIAAQVRIPLPFSPVPLTLQTFAVLATGAILGSGAGAGAQALYVLGGAVGLPIFSGGSAYLSGATVGYLVAFPVAAWIVGCLRDRCGRYGLPVGLALGTLTIYTLGAGWLVIGLDRSLPEAVALGVVPFIAGDALKLAGVMAIAGLGRRVLGRAAGRHADERS